MSGLAEDSLSGVTFGKPQDGLRGVVSPWTTCWALLFFKTIENNDGALKRNITIAAVYTQWSQRSCVAPDDLVAPEKIIGRP